MRRALFLDIDGVLNTERFQLQCKAQGFHTSDEYGPIFDPIAVDNLTKIINETEVDIVISSSWKFYGLSKLKTMWNKRGLPGRIIGVTPCDISDDLLLTAGDEKDWTLAKGLEINE